jgi:hypothetical protein
MPFGASKTPSLGPSTIPIHNDGQMAGQSVFVQIFHTYTFFLKNICQHSQKKVAANKAAITEYS